MVFTTMVYVTGYFDIECVCLKKECLINNGYKFSVSLRFQLNGLNCSLISLKFLEYVLQESFEQPPQQVKSKK